MGTVREEYSSVVQLGRAYWRAYGGLAALVRSPYLHAALIVTLLLFSIWLQPEWWNTPLSILPNVLGFTLGGYALLIAFGDEKFRTLMIKAGSPERASPFLAVSATFVHFIVIQVSALVYALLARGLYFRLGEVGIESQALSSILSGPLAAFFWFFGFFLFVYALFTALAAAFALFRLSTWFDWFVRESDDETADDAGGSGKGASADLRDNTRH